jgi:hypothetical protein
MERDRIIITKDLIPYTFNISLPDELFTLTVDYNKKHDFFTIALEKDGDMVCEGEPIIYGFPLFRDIYLAGKYPVLDIIPIDESGEQTSVTFENFNETVFLTVDNGEESGEDIE